MKELFDATPVTSNPTPVTGNPTPVTRNPTPVTRNPTPVMSNPTPVTRNPTPVMSNPTPVMTRPPAPAMGEPAAPMTSAMTRITPSLLQTMPFTHQVTPIPTVPPPPPTRAVPTMHAAMMPLVPSTTMRFADVSENYITPAAPFNQLHSYPPSGFVRPVKRRHPNRRPVRRQIWSSDNDESDSENYRHQQRRQRQLTDRGLDRLSNNKYKRRRYDDTPYHNRWSYITIHLVGHDIFWLGWVWIHFIYVDSILFYDNSLRWIHFIFVDSDFCDKIRHCIVFLMSINCVLFSIIQYYLVLFSTI